MAKQITVEQGESDKVIYVQLIDTNMPEGHKIMGSASGDVNFISKILIDWLKDF